jgi:hypothetical protein
MRQKITLGEMRESGVRELLIYLRGLQMQPFTPARASRSRSMAG